MHLLNALAQVVVKALALCARRTAALDGTPVDIGPYDGVCLAVLNASAAAAGTNPTLDVKLQHCDTLAGAYTDVTGGAFTQVTGVAGTAGVQVLKLNAGSLKQYVKAVGTLGGTNTPTFDYGVSLHLVPKVV